jgi:hypothetical protein
VSKRIGLTVPADRSFPGSFQLFQAFYDAAAYALLTGMKLDIARVSHLTALGDRERGGFGE